MGSAGGESRIRGRIGRSRHDSCPAVTIPLARKPWPVPRGPVPSACVSLRPPTLTCSVPANRSAPIYLQNARKARLLTYWQTHHPPLVATTRHRCPSPVAETPCQEPVETQAATP